MNKKLIFLQDGNKECGSAALLSIIRYYGGDIPINKLVEMTNTTKEGTNFLNLKNASQKLGISVSGYKINKYEQLNELTPPFIAQFSENGYNHFVVIYKIKNDKVLIMNPAKGKEVIKKDEFLKKWTNNILVFVPYKKLSIFKENK